MGVPAFWSVSLAKSLRVIMLNSSNVMLFSFSLDITPKVSARFFQTSNSHCLSLSMMFLMPFCFARSLSMASPFCPTNLACTSGYQVLHLSFLVLSIPVRTLGRWQSHLIEVFVSSVPRPCSTIRDFSTAPLCPTGGCIRVSDALLR